MTLALALWAGGCSEKPRLTARESIDSSAPIIDSTATDPIGQAIAGRAFLSDAVDTKVDVDPTSKVKPAYPASLRDAGIEGEVLARFVVDSTGRVDTASIQIVRSAHRFFTESVRAALARMHYLPAIKDGRRVRQVLEQPFTFFISPN